MKFRCELYWPFLDRVNEKSGKYQVDLSCLSEKAVLALKEAGVTHVRQDSIKRPNQEWFVTAKSKRPIPAVDRDGNLITASIGNGTKATVTVNFYPWTDVSGKKRYSPGIKKLVVDELVMYSPPDDEEEDEEDVVL